MPVCGLQKLHSTYQCFLLRTSLVAVSSLPSEPGMLLWLQPISSHAGIEDPCFNSGKSLKRTESCNCCLTEEPEA